MSIGASLVRLLSADQRAHLRGEFVADAGQRVAQAQHQRGVEDVLAGQTAVQPPGGFAAGAVPQQRDQPGDRVAVRFGAPGDRVDIGGR